MAGNHHDRTRPGTLGSLALNVHLLEALRGYVTDDATGAAFAFRGL
jgi:hypothetical protein